jgi:hypothetical protein
VPTAWRCSSSCWGRKMTIASRLSCCLFLMLSLACFADNQYKIVISSNTVATDGSFTWNCTKNGTIVMGPITYVQPAGSLQSDIAEILRVKLRTCIGLNEGTITEVKESNSPPVIHGAVQHDSTVEATANKNAASGYAGLDAQAKVPIAQLPTGVTSATVPLGNDSRLSDARLPLAHTHAESDVTNLVNDLVAKQAALGFTPVQKVASGTVTFTTTAVASGACQATITIAATGALTTDTATWTYNSLPSLATDGRLTMNFWLTAGNINFARCNNTAASVTPTAKVANWIVVR